MAGIQANTGLITGIPIAETVKQLLAIEARPRDLLVTRTEAINDEAAAIAELTASVLSFQFTARKFEKTSLFNTSKATSSNTTFLSANVTGTPKTGNYQFTPIRTAQSQQLLSSGVASLDQPLSAGKIQISHGPRLDDGLSLDQLNGGQGVQRGKIRITDRSGSNAAVDLSYAQTIDDVLDAINNNDDIQVTATVDGDHIKLTDNTGLTTSNLIVQSVGSSSTAADLGLDGINTASNTATGADLLSLHANTLLSSLNDGNGISVNRSAADLSVSLRDGTSLEIDLGKAAAPEDFATAAAKSGDARLSFTSVQNGSAYDGVQIIFQDNGSVTQGSETVVFDGNAKTLTFQIDAGNTTAADIITALENDVTASTYFSAETVNNGLGDGIIDPNKDSVTTAGTTGTATATTTSVDPNAAITLTAAGTGGTYDDVTIVFVDDAGVTAGAETVTYDDSDPNNKTLTVRIDAGNSTGTNVIDAINGDPTASALFTASNGSGSDGSGLVDLTDTAVTTGGVLLSSATTPDDAANGQVNLTAKVKGAEYDGYQISYVADGSVTQGNEVVEFDADAKTITVRIAEGETTADDVVTALNGSTAFAATFTASKPTSATGDRIIDASIVATTDNGEASEASEPQTLGELIDTINAIDPSKLRAQISDDGDSIELIDLSTDNGGTFAVSSINNSSTAEDLGLTGTASGGTLTSRRLQAGLKTTLLTTLNGGQGLGTLGTIALTDRSGSSANVDLSSAETIEDVIELINASGLAINAKVNASGTGISLTETSGSFTSNFIVANADGTNSAELLNIEHDSTSLTVNSGNLGRQFVNEDTKLDDLKGGEGIERGKFLIKNSEGNTRLFDLTDTSIETVGDLIDKINAELSLNVEARINDRGDGIVLIDKTSGSGTLTVTEGSGINTAASLGILGSGVEKEVDGVTRTVIEGSEVTTIDIEAGETLQDVIDKINDADIGLSASSLNTGSGTNPIRMSLTSTISGRKGRVVIDSSQSQFRFDEIVEAQDALLLFGSASNAAAGILTSSSTNKFSEVLEGVSLTVNAPSESAINVNVQVSDEPLVKAAQEFVDQYNALRDKLDAHTFFNESDNSTGILFGSNEALRVDTELGNLITSRLVGNGKFQSLEQLGFEFNDTGKLSLNSTKLKAAFEDDPEAVETFFTRETTGFAHKVFNLTEQFAGAGSSLLVSRAQTLQARAELNTDRIKAMTDRLERKSEQLLKEFYNLELTIGKLQNNQTALSQIQYIAPDGSAG
ncbi:flagellar filament capping protein FliD [Bremerella sp. P1]|uniref:flagellar filament capping protein FliD n=1 Tax=Bremerella sp. P1 TaxID=3026424 RepID=UPI002368117A|nr:flagellar filament capping protein FliD [Bremerella sp. P1]WDI39811.1 flagellar filament capping protein FliD [Bremerella sp. P1]